MKRVLVIGDEIQDIYTFGRATRLCPEGPVPVIIPERTETRGGGARLVANQLEALIGVENVTFLSGSQSKKKRIFADDRLICRLDEDSYAVDETFYQFARPYLRSADIDLLVISDYGKGAFTEIGVKDILCEAENAKIPVLVDAKNNFEWYYDRAYVAFALFPNEHERPNSKRRIIPCNVIQKLGSRGCSVNGTHIPLETEHAVRDTTGAGDTFIAAFAAYMAYAMDRGVAVDQINLESCARFANKVAARSVEFVGTKVVDDIKL